MIRKRLGFFIGLVGLVVSLYAYGGEEPDWRKTADTDKKVENLVTVMPGTSNYMIEIGERYKNLYWAARQGKWKFAEYQAEEIEEMLERLSIARSERAESASKFLGLVYPDIIKATRSRKFERFEKSFKKMRRQCIQCHVTNNYSFIKPGIPRRASSPVLNME